MSAVKIRLATVWLDGCSGCHMSILDTDERLAVLAESADKPHGLRESYIVDPDGYVWVPDRPLPA